MKKNHDEFDALQSLTNVLFTGGTSHAPSFQEPEPVKPPASFWQVVSLPEGVKSVLDVFSRESTPSKKLSGAD